MVYFYGMTGVRIHPTLRVAALPNNIASLQNRYLFFIPNLMDLILLGSYNSYYVI